MPLEAADTGTSVSVSHLSFLRASFSLSNLSLWVISWQRSRVNKNTPLWFLTHLGLPERRGDDTVQCADITFHTGGRVIHADGLFLPS